MRKFLVAAIAVALSVPGFASSPAHADLSPIPKKIEAWAWCGVHPDDPSAQAAANSMASVGGIDATFGPCYLPWTSPPPGYTPEEPGVEGQDPNYRYVSPANYMRLLQINAAAGMKTVVYDNRVWSTNQADRDAAFQFWSPVLGNIAAWDMGDEFTPNNPLDPEQWDILIERWNIVRSDIAVRTGVAPFTNHLEELVDLALTDLVGSELLTSFTRYTEDLGVATAERHDPNVKTLMCGVNAFKHSIFNPTAEKIVNDMARLVRAGCDRFLVFGGFVVYDKGATRGGPGVEQYGSSSIADQSGRATSWATAVFKGQTLYQSTGPARLLETRPGLATADGQSNGIGVRAAGTTTPVQVAGRGGVPADATSAVLNITATNEAADGFITAYPCDAPRPNASHVNFLRGVDVATAAFLRLDPSGRICLFNSMQTDIVVDVNGFNPAGSSFVPLTPARILETRGGYSTIDGQYNAVGFRGAGSVTELQVAGRGGVAAGAEQVALTVTATEVRNNGFVTVFPCGTPPTASNLNYTIGSTVTNAVLAPLRADGRLCLFTSQDIDLVVDVNGYFPGSSTFVSMAPSRFVDTRLAPPPPVQGLELEPGGRDPNPPAIVQIAGRNDIPATATAAVLNVTVTDPTLPGFATVYPCGTTRPLASNINFNAGATVPNLVVAQIGNAGAVCIYKSVGAQLIVDVSGYQP